MTNKKEILKKCGWNENQTNYLGTMVHDIEKEDGSTIMNIISQHQEKEIVVELFIPNKEIGERIAFTYLAEENKINQSKSTSDIKTLEDMNKVLDLISYNIQNIKGLFMPTKKYEPKKNDVKLK